MGEVSGIMMRKTRKTRKTKCVAEAGGLSTHGGFPIQVLPAPMGPLHDASPTHSLGAVPDEEHGEESRSERSTENTSCQPTRNTNVPWAKAIKHVL